MHKYAGRINGLPGESDKIHDVKLLITCICMPRQLRVLQTREERRGRSCALVALAVDRPRITCNFFACRRTVTESDIKTYVFISPKPKPYVNVCQIDSTKSLSKRSDKTETTFLDAYKCMSNQPDKIFVKTIRQNRNPKSTENTLILATKLRVKIDSENASPDFLDFLFAAGREPK